MSDKNTGKLSGMDIPYNNRELSWMDFNYRVLEKKKKKENPVLERLKFLAITASNLDEFFMVRVAGVMDDMHDRRKEADVSGLTPKQLFKKLTVKIHDFWKKQYSCLNRSIMPVLNKNGLLFISINELNEKQKEFVDDYYHKMVFPVLTPLAVDTSRPFPLLANKSLNIAVRLKSDDESVFAVVQVPSLLPRFIELPQSDEKDKTRKFIMLEDIIMDKLDSLFELYKIEKFCPASLQ